MTALALIAAWFLFSCAAAPIIGRWLAGEGWGGGRIHDHSCNRES